MIAQHDLVNKYNKLYVQLRNYIWNFNQVEKIADLEIAIYRACPDIHEIRAALSKLYLECVEVIREDEELKSAYDSLKTLADGDDSIYTMLNKVDEVLK